MSWSSENGYTPLTVEEILAAIMAGINTQFSKSFTTETFEGTNFYKYMYAAAQEMALSETKKSEIFEKLTQYLEVTNEEIQRPVATPQGIIDALALEGYTASVKPPLDADAGKIYICVDLDDADPDYATDKLAVATIIKDSIAGGIISQGSESTAIVLSNGQSFDFKFTLPNEIASGDPLFRLTLTLSENNQSVVGDPDDVKQLLIDNIEARYKLGKNFEPQKYFNQTDAPWTSTVLLEYKINGVDWVSTVYDSAYDAILRVKLANISLVEN